MRTQRGEPGDEAIYSVQCPPVSNVETDTMLVTICRRRVASTNPRLSSLVHHTHTQFFVRSFCTHIAKEAGNKAIQQVCTISQSVPKLHAPFPGMMYLSCS